MNFSFPETNATSGSRGVSVAKVSSDGEWHGPQVLKWPRVPLPRFGGCPRVPFLPPGPWTFPQFSSHQTPKFPPTPSMYSDSASHVRMINLQYCTLTVIRIPATIPRDSPLLYRPVPVLHTLPQPSSLGFAFGFQPSTVNFFFFTLLRTLLHCAKPQLIPFQYLPHSLHKTPGRGGHTLQPSAASFLDLTARRSPQATIPFGIRTSKTQDVKSFRIRTYEKGGWGLRPSEQSGF